MTRLLIVAPSPAFRNSIRFALEAEGYVVTAAASTRDVAVRPADFACTVLDHHGLEGGPAEWRNFVDRFRPVVLLANDGTHAMTPFTFRTLTKPSLGAALADAVTAAVEVDAAAETAHTPV